ncbi:hypothetical protein BLEM_1888 [Bifidobacterium lemurum]|uniref:Uncharacterized protein n=1 Tax=Bifidobacterium lemurum TaxID=1603886 RepID=A0A261FM22_9BIFI|nr:hypothetical protein [Bifidobacterium lemurum]OZG60199.1 hypothetical protein BLEM_1888 [Bifidobacterium lemurum]QOL34098.1 hypothetical protein BL8807_10200 [Bifidobacterium lemurum]
MNATNATAETTDFIGYEYRTMQVPADLEGLVIDSYRSFGWMLDAASPRQTIGNSELRFKRDRQIRNKAELSRLQRQFDSSIQRVNALHASPRTKASIVSFTLGILGCVFLGGSMFSYLGGLMALMIILAVPGFILWIAAYPAYRAVLASAQQKAAPQIEAVYDSIYELTKRASGLLG